MKSIYFQYYFSHRTTQYRHAYTVITGRRLPVKTSPFGILWILYGSYMDQPNNYTKHLERKFCQVIFMLCTCISCLQNAIEISKISMKSHMK